MDIDILSQVENVGLLKKLVCRNSKCVCVCVFSNILVLKLIQELK